MKTYHQEKAAQTVHQARGPMSVDGRGTVSQELTRLYTRARVCEKKRGLSLLSPCPRRQLQLVYLHLESHDSPRNPPRGQKGAEGVTPHGREVIFAVSEGTSRTPAQDYKNPGTRLPRILYQVHRTPQQCAPCSFLTLF
mgnify:CR=1 FL=1